MNGGRSRGGLNQPAAEHPEDCAAPHVVSVSFRDIRAEVLLHALEEAKIYVASGSACSSNHPAISGTLKAIGVEKQYLDATVRFSFSFDTTKEEIDAVTPDGIGLLRTELLYMKNNSFPDEEEQIASYNDIIKNFDEKDPIIIRTLDIGADKQLPYFQMKNETNSFLGLRGIRFSLSEKNIFKTQLRAILRTAYGRNVKIMYPMITNINEIREANELLKEVKEELRQEDKKFKDDIEVGIMIEVP